MMEQFLHLTDSNITINPMPRNEYVWVWYGPKQGWVRNIRHVTYTVFDTSITMYFMCLRRIHGSIDSRVG